MWYVVIKDYFMVFVAFSMFLLELRTTMKNVSHDSQVSGLRTPEYRLQTPSTWLKYWNWFRINTELKQIRLWFRIRNCGDTDEFPRSIIGNYLKCSGKTQRISCIVSTVIFPFHIVWNFWIILSRVVFKFLGILFYSSFAPVKCIILENIIYSKLPAIQYWSTYNSHPTSKSFVEKFTLFKRLFKNKSAMHVQGVGKIMKTEILNTFVY